MQCLDDTTLAALAEYSINFTEHENKFCFESTLYWIQQIFICKSNRNSSIQSKILWIIGISTLFRNHFKKFSICKYERRLNGYIYDFSIDYFDISVNNIVKNHKYLIKKNKIK